MEIRGKILKKFISKYFFSKMKKKGGKNEIFPPQIFPSKMEKEERKKHIFPLKLNKQDERKLNIAPLLSHLKHKVPLVCI